MKGFLFMDEKGTARPFEVAESDGEGAGGSGAFFAYSSFEILYAGGLGEAKGGY